ncbi:hypothetical protein BJX63DRAFT_270088 [Aspergillus granulosus]|uniref:Myb-like domain-containing protein n=1 Tax=Aspergillus granulosus TaxID=176169 RepID=A0ABR4H895_9EURO
MSSPDLENDDKLTDTPLIIPRASRGTYRKALRALQSTLPSGSIEAYQTLFEQQDNLNTGEDNFTTTQDGIVIWTAQEKQLLYQALDRKGKHRIREIAAVIGSKSELEVQEYLRLLQKGVRRQHFSDSHPRTAILGDIPAAAEISEQCCKSLEQHAELLCLVEQVEENIEGKLRYGRQWIVDQETAEQLDAAFDTENGETPAVDAKVAAHMSESESQNETESSSTLNAPAELFNMAKWILLSERLFMNFGGTRLEDNWVNIAFENETPSITADAFTIFYDIALTAIRRLVHATHFFAASRVQRNENSGRPSARVVSSSDVRRAANTLNMRTDSSEFWTGLARRCGLEVVDERHIQGWNPISLDHDEVEDLLSRRELPKEPYKTDVPRSMSRRCSSSTASGISLDSVDPESSEDEHAEAVDRQNSAIDELLCWTVLGQSPPENLEAELSNKHIPPRPAGKRKTMEELVDWRERTLHRSEWEELGYETQNLDRDLNSGRKRPRLATLSPSPSCSRSFHKSKNNLSSSGSDSGSSTPQYKSREKITNSNSDSDSDPAFHPESPEQKSKSRITRTSSRKRASVSYTPQQLFGSDMEMDLDTGLEHDGTDAMDTNPEQNEGKGEIHTEPHAEPAGFGDEDGAKDDLGYGNENEDDGEDREDGYGTLGPDNEFSTSTKGRLASGSEDEYRD